MIICSLKLPQNLCCEKCFQCDLIHLLVIEVDKKIEVDVLKKPQEMLGN